MVLTLSKYNSQLKDDKMAALSSPFAGFDPELCLGEAAVTSCIKSKKLKILLFRISEATSFFEMSQINIFFFL